MAQGDHGGGYPDRLNRPVPAGPHVYNLRVYFEDTDAGGIVYHASYLRFAERARTECLRDLGMPHAELMERHRLIFVVRRVEVDYLRSARLDDVLAVATSVAALGGASVTLDQLVSVGGETSAALRVVLVCMRQSDGKPVRIPEPWRSAFVALRPAEEVEDARAGD